MTRSKMVSVAATGLLLSLCVSAGGAATKSSAAASLEKPVRDEITIYKDKNAYAAFPNFFKAEDGTLVVTFNIRPNGSHFESSTGRLFISTDKGATWHESSRTYLNPALRAKGGEYVIPSVNGWRKVDAATAETLAQGGVKVRDSAGTKFVATGANVKVSDNGGKTWRTQALDLPPHALLMSHNISAYLATSKNVRLFSVYGKMKPEDKDTVFFLRSTDDGKTWKFRPMFSAQNELGFNETALVETSHGDIVAVMRADPDSVGYLYTSVSRDQGLTWSAPRKTSISGYPANAIRLKDNRIFVCYGYRKAPMGIRGGILNDDYTGLVGNEIVMRNDAQGPPSGVGYPIAVETEGAKVSVVYYITGSDGITHIAESIVAP